MAKRVTLSIIRSTSLPWRMKYSATVVPAMAQRRRRRGLWSLVETTTTLRFNPSSPRSFSMNSRSSRPRSPTRVMTFTSADVLRATMPSRVDLPTPEPEKMPTRWPLPRVSRPSMARTPVESTWLMRLRCMGLGGGPWRGM